MSDNVENGRKTVIVALSLLLNLKETGFSGTIVKLKIFGEESSIKICKHEIPCRKIGTHSLRLKKESQEQEVKTRKDKKKVKRKKKILLMQDYI